MDRYRISLRIRHPRLPAAALRAALPLAPGRTWDAGALRTDPSGRPLGGTNADTYATFALSEGTGWLAEALADAAERMAPHRDLFAAWRAEGGSVEFFVGWFPEGGNSEDRFEPELLARLGELGLRLSLDIYACDES